MATTAHKALLMPSLSHGRENATLDLFSTTCTGAAKLCIVAILAKWHAIMCLVGQPAQTFSAAFCLTGKAITVPLVSKCLNHRTSMNGVFAARALPQVIPLRSHSFLSSNHGRRPFSHTRNQSSFIVFVVRCKVNNTARAKCFMRPHAYTSHLICWIINAQAMATCRDSIIHNEVFNDLSGTRAHSTKPEAFTTFSRPRAIAKHSLA